MLTFMRNKVVGIEQRNADTLVAYGYLDDDIYGLELVVSVEIPERKILFIEGRFNRYTTPECPKAIPVLQQAVGLCMEDEGFSKRVNKEIGRKGCRHFANLLLECCSTATQACKTLSVDRPLPAETRVTVDEAKAEKNERGAVLSEKRTERKHDSQFTTIDLHVHTSPASPCGMSGVDAQIEEAKRIGMDGICLTDHNFLWDRGKVEDLRQKHGFLVLRGSEVLTDQGDVLVYGLEERINGVIRIEDLRAMVLKVGGFMIAAHPFRGFLTFGVGQLGLTKDRAAARPVFKWVDAVEVLNGKGEQLRL
jgi:hypothetical protein